MDSKKLDIAIAYAAKRRANKPAPVLPLAEEAPQPTSLAAAIASKFAKPAPAEEPISNSEFDDTDLDLFDEPATQPELPSTGNALADKIRARILKR